MYRITQSMPVKSKPCTKSMLNNTHNNIVLIINIMKENLIILDCI